MRTSITIYIIAVGMTLMTALPAYAQNVDEATLFDPGLEADLAADEVGGGEDEDEVVHIVLSHSLTESERTTLQNRLDQERAIHGQ